MIKVDKEIPIPPKRYSGGPHPKYPFAEMATGDSFFVAGEKSRVPSAASAQGKKLGRKFASRRVTENGVKGVRVWRLS